MKAFPDAQDQIEALQNDVDTEGETKENKEAYRNMTFLIFLYFGPISWILLGGSMIIEAISNTFKRS